jgi:hypothetical protein
MHMFEIALYVLTTGGMFFFGFREHNLRNQLTDDVLRGSGSSQIAEQFKRQRILNDLPPETLILLKRATIFKLVFFALFVVEVLVFQRYVP